MINVSEKVYYAVLDLIVVGPESGFTTAELRDAVGKALDTDRLPYIIAASGYALSAIRDELDAEVLVWDRRTMRYRLANSYGDALAWIHGLVRKAIMRLENANKYVGKARGKFQTALNEDQALSLERLEASIGQAIEDGHRAIRELIGGPP